MKGGAKDSGPMSGSSFPNVCAHRDTCWSGRLRPYRYSGSCCGLCLLTVQPFGEYFVSMSTLTSSSVTLGATPLLCMLASLVDRELTGTLTFETPEHVTGAIVFDRGTLMKVAAEVPRCRLSELLIERGWLAPSEAEASYREAVERKELHGQVLLARKLVDEKSLLQVLLYQFVRKLDWVATRPAQTLLALHDGTDLLSSMRALSQNVSVLAVLWAMAKEQVDEGHKRSLLKRAADRPIRLHPQSLPELFGFNEGEMALVDRLRHPGSSLVSLLCQIELPRMTAEALVYVLLLTRHIDLGDGQTPMGMRCPTTQPSPRVSGEPPPRRSRFPDRSSPPRLEHHSTQPGHRHRVNRSLSTHLLQRAEELLKSDRILQAEAEAERARALDPDNPTCAATCLWIQSLLTTSSLDLHRLLVALSASLGRDPMNVTIQYYRSQLLKRLGRIDEAIAQWHRITQLEPRHIDALRELGVWEARRFDHRNAPQKLESGIREPARFEPPSIGLLDKIFQRSR
jgi:tetratricopeptide (TPR) repeat protein